MVTVDLIRHGETPVMGRYLGRTNVALASRGWEQMDTALHDRGPWDAVVSSPLKRCADFARAFARGHGLGFEIDERFREIDFGAWEGRSAAEISAGDPGALERFWNDPLNNTPPQAEPLRAFASRVLAAWSALIEGHAERGVLLVTHGGVIGVIRCDAERRPLCHLLRREVPHGSIYRIAINEKRSDIEQTIEGVISLALRPGPFCG
ncbi:MAG: histidine phosphatase family protein [Gammaproteobacteria bacterium]